MPSWFNDFISIIDDQSLQKLFLNLKNFIASTFPSIMEVELFEFFSSHIIICSSQDRAARALILDKVKNQWVSSENQIENISVSSARQFDDLRKAHDLLVKTKEAIQNRIGHEYIAFDLKDSLLAVQNILGIVYDDQILDKVFKEFCLGK